LKNVLKKSTDETQIKLGSPTYMMHRQNAEDKMCHTIPHRAGVLIFFRASLWFVTTAACEEYFGQFSVSGFVE
jgi:hypothetical protein